MRPSKSPFFSVCILAKNAERTLEATLSSVKRFPEVILLDTGSTDGTISMAKRFPNVIVHETPFTGFGPLRNLAASLASHDWILALDSDEVLSPLLQEEILAMTADPQNVYEIEFHNFYRGKRIYGCGWHPEHHIRLYHKKATRFDDKAVHEGVERRNLKVARLRYPILHTPYLSISDFLAKMQRYSDLFAVENKGKKRASLRTALFHAAAAFFKSYFLKRGFLSGSNGFIISFYNGCTAYYKYLKLMETNRI